MKKPIIIFIIFALLASACENYIVVKRDPTVLNSTILLSGEVTGDIYPEVRTISMRASGQASNFLLLEIRGMESFCNTTSIEVLDSLAGNELYLNIIDNGTPGTERCYRNAQFWVGPFESDRFYTLHLSEMQDAFYRDTLLLTFDYDQHLDIDVASDSCYWMLSEKPFNNISAKTYNQGDVPDFHSSPYYWDNRNTIHFFDTDSGVLIQVIASSTCGLHHDASWHIDGDTLFLMGEIDPPGMDCCDEFYFYDFLIKDYDQQIFYYQFISNDRDWAWFEGFYNTP
ncbi:MAG: hypothetical protein K9N05_01010 [Candidatus Marinimicrobia bacterium]|nr:hypothetical protein [Candidatus Neomarinimicrobiota bacterium]